MDITLSEKLYRVLLKLYPASYRRKYEKPMVQLFRDLHKEASTKGFIGMVVLWLHIFFIDFIPSFFNQHLDKSIMEKHFQKGGEIMPQLLWKSASILFVPGFLLLGLGIGLIFGKGDTMGAGALCGIGLGIIAMTIGLLKK